MLYFGVVISAILIIVGLLGVLVPFLPGLPLAFCGALLLSYITGFKLISLWSILFLAVLALLSVLVDYLAGLIGARWGKASLWGLVGAITGLVVGILSFGIIGMILGPALGVLVFELVAKRGDHRHAVKAAQSTLISSFLGIAVNAILAIIFMTVLVLALIF